MKKILILLLISISVVTFGETTNVEKESLKIEKITIRNQEELPTELIKKDMLLEEGMQYSTTKMTKDYKMLKSNKYLENVNIFPKIETGSINLIIELTEKENIKKLLEEDGIVPISEREKIDKSLIIKSIDIYGNKEISTENIMEEIDLEVGGYFSKKETLSGKEKILDMGYFRDVSPEVLQYKNGVHIKYNVLENPIINEIKIQGNTLIETSKLKAGLKTEEGSVYNIKKLRSDIDSILKKYRDTGYILASVGNIGLDDEFNLNIELYEGVLKEVKFEKLIKTESGKGRDLSTKGEELKTKEYVLEREVVLKEGEVVTMKKMQKTMKNIFRLGYFKDIKQEFQKDPNNPNKVTLILKLDEQKSGSISGGISYGSVVGLVGNISIQDNNFRGESKNLKANFEMSSKNERTYELSYSDPWIKGTKHLSVGTSIYKKEIQNSDDSYTDKTGFTLSGGKNLTEKVRVKLGTKLEKIREYDEDEKLKEGGKYSIIEIYPSIYYDTRNNYLNTTEGEYARLSLVNGLKLGGDYYTTVELELRKFHEFLDPKNTLAYRLVTGIASNTTPESQRFYVGGGNTLRGYPNYQFLGEEELYINIENRYKLNDTIQLVGFIDIGRSWKSFKDFQKLKDLKKSYGFGIRANTPIGPLRFDYGWPLGDSERKNGEFHFNMGQLF